MPADWGATARKPTFYDCPVCRAPSTIVAEDPIPCKTWNAVEVDGRIHMTEGLELLVIVTLTCAGGHFFHGPEEMLRLAPEEYAARWP